MPDAPLSSMGTMKRPNDLRMLGKPLELLLDDSDLETSAKRGSPPSRSMKLRVLDQLDHADRLDIVRGIVPLVLAVSSVVTLVLAVTLWARRS